MLKIVSALLVTCLTEEIFARTVNINLQSKESRYKDFLPKRQDDFTDNSKLSRIMYGISPRDSNSEYYTYKDNFVREKHLGLGPYSRVTHLGPYPRVSISNPPYNRKLYNSHQPRRHQTNGILSSGDLFIYPWHYNKQLHENDDGRNFLILRHKFEFPISVREPFQGNSLRYQNGKELLDKLRQDEAFDAYSPRAVTNTVRNSNYDYPYYDFTGLYLHKR